MTGLELLKAPATTAGEIADIISKPCPPIVPEVCDHISCRECWLAWLTGGEPKKKKGPPDEQTAPDEEGLHPNLVEHLRQQLYVVSPIGIVKDGQRYNSNELLAHVGKQVSVECFQDYIIAKTKDGQEIGKLTPYQP